MEAARVGVFESTTSYILIYLYYAKKRSKYLVYFWDGECQSTFPHHHHHHHHLEAEEPNSLPAHMQSFSHPCVNPGKHSPPSNYLNWKFVLSKELLEGLTVRIRIRYLLYDRSVGYTGDERGGVSWLHCRVFIL